MIQTITTVGYGDINPVNSKERIYTLFVMIVGVVSFAFISGSVAAIMQSYDEENVKQREISTRVWSLKDQCGFGTDLHLNLLAHMAKN